MMNCMCSNRVGRRRVSPSSLERRMQDQSSMNNRREDTDSKEHSNNNNNKQQRYIINDENIRSKTTRTTTTTCERNRMDEGRRSCSLSYYSIDRFIPKTSWDIVKFDRKRWHQERSLVARERVGQGLRELFRYARKETSKNNNKQQQQQKQQQRPSKRPFGNDTQVTKKRSKQDGLSGSSSSKDDNKSINGENYDDKLEESSDRLGESCDNSSRIVRASPASLGEEPYTLSFDEPVKEEKDDFEPFSFAKSEEGDPLTSEKLQDLIPFSLIESTADEGEEPLTFTESGETGGGNGGVPVIHENELDEEGEDDEEGDDMLVQELFNRANVALLEELKANKWMH